jgi:hypothetical protein
MSKTNDWLLGMQEDAEHMTLKSIHIRTWRSKFRLLMYGKQHKKDLMLNSQYQNKG